MSLSLLKEDSNPMIRLVLIHKEGMHTVRLFAWRFTIFRTSAHIDWPHGIDAIFQEELVLGSLTKSHHSSKVISFHGKGFNSNPVKIGIVDQILNLEEWLSLPYLLSKVYLERVSLYD